MYLKELTIAGFKSFAKKSDLEFSVPITAIVGPNGSGKSNVAEAFRFVLGEQSVKSMRGKRGEDLIWGGSDAVSRGNRASVAVTFDNTGRHFDLDFDEVLIERIVHRDGQNEYKINNSAVRLKDVHELLARANIGATGHHIISQGEADRVISAGPKDRREMIEDALGLKVYQLKKHEALKKLTKTQANIAETESLRREAAPHLRYLKKQVERAERSLAVQEELTTAYAEYLKREDTYLALRVDQLNAERRQPAKDQAAARATIAELKATLAESATEPDTSALDAVLVAEEQAQAKRVEAERALSTVVGQIELLERRLAAARASTEKEQFVPHDTVAKVVTEVTEQAEDALTSQQDGQIKTTLATLRDTLQAFLRDITVVTTDTTEADEKELARLQAVRQEQQTALTAATEAETAARQQVATERAAVTAAGQQSQEAERALFAASTTERETTQTLNAIDTELAVLERDRQAFTQELQEAVTLLGRGALQYTQCEPRNADGTPATAEDILGEGREQQRERQRAVEKLKIRLEELGVGATDELLKEYDDAKARDEFLAKELTDLTTSVANLETLVHELDEQLHEQFVAGIDKISAEFNRFFTLMFGGGSATLKRVQIKQVSDNDEETLDPIANEGVDLAVALPNKRVTGLEMLSGGERALTSIALIFAMSQVNPPPFIILDETDAALDEANSRRYGDMIEALAERSQLVLITHNRETMSRAGILYGITMAGDGVSKVLSVKFDEAAAHAK